MKEAIKKSWPIIAVLVLMAVIFNVVSFVLADELGSNFWCGYIFIMIALVCIIINVIITARDSEKGLGEKALFVKAPSLLISVLHFGIQFMLGIAVMIIPSYSVKISVCIQILVFLMYICIILALFMYERKAKK